MLPRVGAATKLHRGFFNASLPAALAKWPVKWPVAIAHFAGVGYATAKEVLGALATGGRLVTGTVLAFDEYCPGPLRAFKWP